AAKVGDGGADKIGDVGANKGAKADADSVKEIANGIKGIVDAAGKAFGGDALKDVKAAADDKKEAGKLFATQAGGGAVADAAAIGKAAGAVTAVSGEQILKAIVEAAGDKANQAGKKADAAKNPIEAAIGTNEAGAGADFGNDMKKSDKIAAAIVLRGVAKDGKFAAAANDAANVKSAVESAVDEVSKWLEEMITAAKEAAKVGTGGNSEKIGDAGDNNNGAKADKDSVNGIANGIKGIVAAAGKAFGKDGALKDVAAAAENDDKKEAGKLFAGKDGNAGAGDIAKAAAAVTAVSGEQILKAIVDAAGDADQAGKKAADAKNPIAAAIGTNEAGAEFGEDEMKKRNDNIAAAIVLRGVAKGGKFAVADADAANVKSAVESAVDEVSKWL
ncbi:variable large family protein, partial [Borreliella afzelii]